MDKVWIALIFVLVAGWFLVGQAQNTQAAVTIVASSSVGASDCSSCTLTDLDVPSGATMLLLFVSGPDKAKYPTSASWSAGGGQSFTLFEQMNTADPGTPTSATAFYLDNPNTGTGTITITMNGSDKFVYRAVALSGTKTSGVGTAITDVRTDSSNNGSPSETNIGPADDGDMIFDVLGTQESSISPDGSQTVLYNTDSVGDGKYMGSSYKDGTGNDDMSWTVGGKMAYIAFNVEEVPAISVSGKALEDEGTTALDACDGSTAMINLRYEGTSQGAIACADGDGAFSFSGLTAPASADTPMFLWIDGATCNNDNVNNSCGSTMILYSGAGDTENATISRNRLIVRSDSATTATSGALAIWDNGLDNDVVYDVDGSNNLTTEFSIKLIVNKNDSYTPGAQITTAVSGTSASTTGDVLIQSGATLDMGGAGSLLCGGDFTNSGTFTTVAGLYTDFTATSTGHSIDIGASSFGNLRFGNSGSGGGWSFVTAPTVNSNFYIQEGTLSGTVGMTVDGGSITSGNGTINLTGGTVTLSASGNFGGNTNWTFNNLTFSGVTTAAGTGDITVLGTLTIDSSDSLDAFSKTWRLTNSGTPFVINGTFTASTSTISYERTTGETNVTNTTYYNLQFNPSSGTPLFTLPTTLIVDPWATTTVDSFGSTGYESSLEMLDANNLFISYRCNSSCGSGEGGDLILASSSDGGATWATTTVDSTGGTGFYSSLEAIDANNLFISYFCNAVCAGGGNGDLMFASSSDGGASWATITVDSDSTGDTGEYTSLEAIDANNIFISYYKEGTDNDLMLASSSDGGATWATTTVDSAGVTGQYTSLEAIDANNLFISYYCNASCGSGGGDDLIFASSSDGGATWATTTVDSTGDTGWYTSLEVLDANNLGISYYCNASCGSGGADDLIFASSSNGGVSWATTTVDSAGVTGQYPSLEAIDANNLFISYYCSGTSCPSGTSSLMFASSSDGGVSWATTTVDSTGDTGQYTSLEAIDANNLFISYLCSSGCESGGGDDLIFASKTVSVGAMVVNNDFTIDGPGALTMVSATTNATNLDINGNFSILNNNGIFYASTSTTSIAGDWIRNSGAFYHNNGTVVFDGSATSTIIGETVWYNFTSTTSNKGLVFATNTVQTIEGLITITGTVGNEIIVRSDTGGTQWLINHQGTENIDRVRLQDSGCTATSTMVTVTASYNDGNNNTACWSIGIVSPDLTQIHYRWRNDDGGERYNWATTTVDSSGDVGQYTFIDATDANNIFISYFDGTTNDLVFASSSNGGATWATTTVDSQGTTGMDTSLEVIDADNLFISYYCLLTCASGGSGDLMFASSSDGGVSWATTTVDSTGTTGRYSSLEVIDANNLFISYYCNSSCGSGGGNDLMFASSSDGGVSWATTTVDSFGDTGWYTSLEATDANNLFISYYCASSCEGGGSGDLMFASSPDGGATWATTTVDSTGTTGQYTSLVAVDANNLFISYYESIGNDLIFASSSDGGATWATSTIDSNVGSNGGRSSISALDSSTIFISYAEIDGSGEGTCDGIELCYLSFAESTDGGSSWGTVEVDRITDFGAGYNSIAVVDAQTLFIAYYNDAIKDLLFASSTAVGASFMADEDIATSSIQKNTNIRLRVEISNEGSADSGSISYQIEYSTATESGWTAVPSSAGSEHWEMGGSIYITDGETTYDISGLDNENDTFVQGELRDVIPTTSGITLTTTEFTELEYSIQATNNAADSGTYYFRVTNEGSTTSFSYDVYAEVSLAGAAAPNVTQIHYRWRYDDGNEVNATFIAAANTSATFSKRSLVRLRIELSNEGGANATSQQFSLEFAEATSSCSEISSSNWNSLVNTRYAAGAYAWGLANTSYVTHGASTTDVSTGGGLNNENTSFIPGYFMSLTNLTGLMTVTTTEFTELEYALWAEEGASYGTTYCFRITNNGDTTNFTFTQYPQANMITTSQAPGRRGGIGIGTAAGAATNQGQGGQGQGGGQGSGNGQGQGGGEGSGGGDAGGGGGGAP